MDGISLLHRSPVSLRRHTKLGNEVGMIIVPLPMTEPDPKARLRAIAHVTETAKREQMAGAGSLLWGLIARMGLSRVFNRRQRFVNVFVTNVTGPPMPVYDPRAMKWTTG